MNPSKSDIDLLTKDITDIVNSSMGHWDAITKVVQHCMVLLAAQDSNSRLSEVELFDQQFPDLWKRGEAKYTEADMRKLSHYVANRQDVIKHQVDSEKENK